MKKEQQNQQKFLEKSDTASFKRIAGSKIPKWMECTWRRIPCKKTNCPLCGHLLKEMARTHTTSESINNFRPALEDIGDYFREALRAIKADAEKKGIDLSSVDALKEPPRPSHFSLYRAVKRWREDIFRFLRLNGREGAWWLMTEPIDDLLWYADIVPAKTYRQLCNRWHCEQNDGYGKDDYIYTKYVLGECDKILQKTFARLMPFDANFALYNARFNELKKEIIRV
ncbi:MAG: hypothetical protein HYW78_02060 [Parcubacteria group bacterium]|nr:hypothetical protein [Parcubacteria group bacterium]